MVKFKQIKPSIAVANHGFFALEAENSTFFEADPLSTFFLQENLTLARKKFDEGRVLMNNFFPRPGPGWSWKEVELAS